MLLGSRKELVGQLSHLVNTYIELAATPVSSTTSSFPFPAKLRRTVSSLTLVPVISVSVPVNPSAVYTNVPRFTGAILSTTAPVKLSMCPLSPLPYPDTLSCHTI